MMTQVDSWKSVLSIWSDSFTEKMNRRNLDLKPHNFCQTVLVRAAFFNFQHKPSHQLWTLDLGLKDFFVAV